jgi:UDP-3-O-[3-hydroxymyristoyl] glucosamine N-acyltransferase
MKLNDICNQFDLKYKGNGGKEFISVKDLQTASADDLAFIANRKQIKSAVNSKAGAFIVNPEWNLDALEGRNLIFFKNPRLAFARIQTLLSRRRYDLFGIHPSAFVAEGAFVSEKTAIHPFVYIGRGCKIADEVVIFPNVYIGDNVRIGKGTVINACCSIYYDCVIGENCIIHSGTVIGSDGFGFVKDGIMNVKIPQVGRVVLGDDCEIGANNTIDRATFGETVIGNNVKTDNQVHIAHNCRIGDSTIIVACSGIAGSTVIGKNVLMAGSSGVIDHITIGDNSVIGTHSIITRDMPAGRMWTGYPAFDHKQWLKVSSLLMKLPEIAKKIKQLESLLPVENGRRGEPE